MGMRLGAAPPLGDLRRVQPVGISLLGDGVEDGAVAGVTLREEMDTDHPQEEDGPDAGAHGTRCLSLVGPDPRKPVAAGDRAKPQASAPHRWKPSKARGTTARRGPYRGA